MRVTAEGRCGSSFGLSTVAFLTAGVVAANYLVYVPSLSMLCLLAANAGLLGFALTDRDKGFFVLLLAMLVLVDGRAAVHHPPGGDLSFFGLTSEYPLVRLSPLQVAVLTTGLFGVLRFLRGARLAVLDARMMGGVGVLLVGSLVGVKNLPFGAKYYASAAEPLVAFVGALVVLRTGRSSPHWWKDVLDCTWLFFTAKAVGYLVLLSLGRYHLTSAANIRVFGNPLFAPAVLLGIAIFLLGKPRASWGDDLRNGFYATILVGAAAVRFVLYFQRGQTLFLVAGLLFLGWLVGRRYARPISKTVYLGIGIIVVAAPLVLTTFDRFKQVDSALINDAIQDEMEAMSGLNVLSEEVNSIRATEWRNILAKNAGDLGGLGLLVGQGFGGYFTNEPVEFPRRLSPADYPAEQRGSQRYREPHSFFNLAVLYAGLIGLFLYAVLVISVVRQCRRSSAGPGIKELMDRLIPAWTFLPTLLASLLISTSNALLLGTLIGAIEDATAPPGSG